MKRIKQNISEYVQSTPDHSNLQGKSKTLSYRELVENRNKKYFELAGYSSYRGFELSREKLRLSSEIDSGSS